MKDYKLSQIILFSSSSLCFCRFKDAGTRVISNYLERW